MTRVAVTGHRGLSPEVTELVRRELATHVATFDPTSLVGLTCLADGADTLFAETVLDHGGRIEVYVPAANYRDALPEEHHAAYDRLLAAASAVHHGKHHESTARSHMDASTAMLATADRVLAVWDGNPARGYGGTADVVSHAKKQQLPVTVIWPSGSHR